MQDSLRTARGTSADRDRRLAETIAWDYRIPLVTNPLIWYDWLRVLLTAGVVLQLMVLLMSWLASGELLFFPPALWAVVGGVFILLFPAAALVFLNAIPARFTLTAKAACYEATTDIDRNRRILVRVVRLAGLLAGSPAALRFQPYGGSDSVPWKDLRRVTGHRRLHAITLSNSWRSVLRLYCQPEHFDTLLEVARERVAAAASARPASRPSAPRSAIAAALASLALTIIATVLGMAWPWYDWEMAPRVLLLAGVLALINGLIRNWWGRLFAIVALCAAGWYFILLVIEAARPVAGGGSAFALHAPESVFSLLGALGLLALGAYHLIRARR